jgi:hypothetical protein
MGIEEGEDYLMFVNNRGGKLEANICGNSMLSSEVNQQQIIGFGSGQIIEEPIAKKDNNGGKDFWLIGLIFIVIGGILTVSFRFRKQRK